MFGIVNGTPLLFVGLERTNAIMIYNVSNPSAPVLEDVIDIAGESGIGARAPEGLQFIAASDNATGRPLIAVTSEADGALSLFAIDTGIAVATSFGSGCPSAAPLTLASDLPMLGNAWHLTTSAVPAGSPFCTFWFGDAALSSPVELTAIGATGCFAYINTNLGAFVAPAVAGSGNFTVTVPGTTALLAYSLTAQASAFTGSSFTTSNGLAAVIGN